MGDLDQILDITKCKCTIQYCIAANCFDCSVQAHITCTCKREEKTPVVDLHYIMDQRGEEKR